MKEKYLEIDVFKKNLNENEKQTNSLVRRMKWGPRKAENEERAKANKDLEEKVEPISDLYCSGCCNRLLFRSLSQFFFYFFLQWLYSISKNNKSKCT